MDAYFVRQWNEIILLSDEVCLMYTRAYTLNKILMVLKVPLYSDFVLLLQTTSYPPDSVYTATTQCSLLKVHPLQKSLYDLTVHEEHDRDCSFNSELINTETSGDETGLHFHDIFKKTINLPQCSHELWSEYCNRMPRRKKFSYTCKIKCGKTVKYWLLTITVVFTCFP